MVCSSLSCCDYWLLTSQGCILGKIPISWRQPPQKWLVSYTLSLEMDYSQYQTSSGIIGSTPLLAQGGFTLPQLPVWSGSRQALARPLPLSIPFSPYFLTDFTWEPSLNKSPAQASLSASASRESYLRYTCYTGAILILFIYSFKSIYYLFLGLSNRYSHRFCPQGTTN